VCRAEAAWGKLVREAWSRKGGVGGKPRCWKNLGTACHSAMQEPAVEELVREVSRVEGLREPEGVGLTVET